MPVNRAWPLLLLGFAVVATGCGASASEPQYSSELVLREDDCGPPPRRLRAVQRTRVRWTLGDDAAPPDANR